MAEAGWYHVESDPPGTVRRWNGVEWIGFAVRDPTNPNTRNSGGAARPHFDQRGARLSMLTLGLLMTLAVLFALIAASIYRDIDALQDSTTDNLVRIRDTGSYIRNIGALSLASAVMVAATATAFSLWSQEAAAVAQTHTFTKASKRSRRFERSAAREVKQPVQVRGVSSLVAAVFSGIFSGGTTSGHAEMGWFGRISNTAMAVSTDPETGVAKISPIKIIAWWALWWVPIPIGFAAWFWLWLYSPVEVDFMTNVLKLTGFLLVLEIVALLCIIMTVGQITRRLSP